MAEAHHYTVGIEWQGNRGSGTTGFRDYGRQVVARVSGKPELLGSADRVFHGDRDRWNPEDLLVAALAECHLLSYLHMAVRAGIVVTAYTDEAVGTLEQEGLGGRFHEIVLRPRVTVADASMVDRAVAAHSDAARHCFIANSVNFTVRHEPTVVVAGE